MSDTTNDTPADATGKKQKRPRVTGLEKAAQLRALAQQIENRARAGDRKKYTRRLIVIGGAALAEARDNPAFSEQLAAIVKARVTKDVDREVVADWQSST